MRAAALVVVGAVLGGLFYLLLIDTRSLPELYVLAGVALLAGVAFLISREQDFTEATFRAAWFRRAWRPLLQVPQDMAMLCAAAFVQLVKPRSARGRFRAVSFEGGMESGDHGRRALAEMFGSLAPNTIVIGVDPETELLLTHQLRRDGPPDDLDVLGLG
jgi:hypothetical protein